MEEIKTLDPISNFKDYLEVYKETHEDFDYTEKDLAYIWFADNVCNTTFYDDSISLKWGKKLYRTVKAIVKETQLNMIEKHYEEYLICLNLINKNDDVLEWGTSIRFAWFEDLVVKQHYIDSIKQIEKIVE